MGKRGYRPAPTALKLAKGTIKPSQIAEPTGEKLTALPPPPETLGVAGRERWAQIGGEVVALGYLETRHLSALEQFAACYDELAACEEAIAKDGRYIETRTGFIGSHPAVKDAKTVTDAIRRWHQEFGLTPSAASSIRLTGKKESRVVARTRA